nr:protein kinase [Planctomycetota bacterium]
MSDLRRALGQTISADRFHTNERAVAATTPRVAVATDAPDLQGARRQTASVNGRASAPRFDLRGLLGVGATGQVYAANDLDLQRDVAIKVLLASERDAPGAVDRFVDEARMAASLEHPNVLPVHDIGVDGRGCPYFTMKKISGRSLGAEIELSTTAGRTGSIASFNAIVGLFKAVGHALSFAHHRGVVHQDIKPDNIMVGDFGETTLVDWGSAFRIGDPHPLLYGTPLYMSPEQVRRDGADVRSDIYCLGATLFHALTLRCPTWSDDHDEFWRKKSAGEIDPPTPAECAAAPAALLAIALKALASDPADRYQSVDAFIADLDHYQAGLAVSAHRDSWLESLRRWHHRHARVIWSTITVASVVLALSSMLYLEKIKEIASWGAPIVVESLIDDGWKKDWRIGEGQFEVRDGWLVSTSVACAMLVYREKLPGDTAIEYDAQILPGMMPCDLSLFWGRQPFPEVLAESLEQPDTYHIQVGAHGGAYSRITAMNRPVAFSPFKPEIGITYRIRVEIVDARITLYVDGRRLCDYVDPFPFTGGYVCLYAYYPGKAFRNLRIYSRGIPQKLSATALGDIFAQGRQFDLGAEQYARVIQSHPGTELADEARYKEGLCHHRRGDPSRAFATWEGLDAKPWSHYVELHRIDALFAEGRHDELLRRFERTYVQADEDVRARMAVQWVDYAMKLTSTVLIDGDPVHLESYLALHDRIMPLQHVADRAAADALNALDRHDAVVARYPGQTFAVVDALHGLGREEDLVDRLTEPTIGMNVLMNLGRSDEIPVRFPTLDFKYVPGIIARGEWDEILARVREPDPLLAIGGFEEIVAKWPTSVQA